MSQTNDLTADLPPPRDDEPASLRQDIIDELTDHLECATRREMLTSPSSHPRETASDSPDSSFRTAQHRALTRFGNPATIARKLWLDAMQEKLMAQKITLTLASIATIACVTLCIMMWFFIRDSREAQAELLGTHLSTLETLLERYPKQETTSVQPTRKDWYEVKLNLVLGEPGGPPAVDFHTTLPSNSSKEGPTTVLDPVANAEGVITFATDEPGNYFVSVTSPWNERGQIKLAVGPGFTESREIVCPTSLPGAADIDFNINVPEELTSESLTFALEVASHARIVSGNEWRLSSRSFSRVYLDAAGNILGYSESNVGVSGPQYHTPPIFRQSVLHVFQIDVLRGLPKGEPDSELMLDQYRPRSGEFSHDLQVGTENQWSIDLPEVFWKQVKKSSEQSAS